MSSVESRLRDRLTGSTPDFDPVRFEDVAVRVRHRRRVAAAATAAGVVAVVGTGTAAAVRFGPSSSDRGSVAGPVPTSVASPPPAAPPSPTTAGRPCPTGQPEGPGLPYAIVDYVDFVVVGGTRYRHGAAPGHDTVGPAALGRQIGTVRCTLEQIGPSPDYRPVDGDAAYLPPGTRLYALAGVPVARRVAAAAGGGRYTVYEAQRTG